MLSERDVQVLELEGRFWKHAGAKEQAARELLGLSAIRYAQILNQLLDTEAALAHDPITVGRLRRLRKQRTSRSLQARST